MKGMRFVRSKSLIYAVLLILVVIIGFLSLAYVKSIPPDMSKSGKIINPHDPRFVAENFRWDDYLTAQELADVFQVIFPIGTDKSYVDKILLAQPEAKASEPVDVIEFKKKTGGFVYGMGKDKILYADPKFQKVKFFVNYSGPSWRPWIDITPGTSRETIVYYDEDNKLLNAIVYVFVVHHYSETDED